MTALPTYVLVPLAVLALHSQIIVLFAFIEWLRGRDCNPLEWTVNIAITVTVFAFPVTIWLVIALACWGIVG